ncbi:hypothetical protein HMPREF1981_00395 [Bacteroides pyogenes F0041]|uniref:Uncharacterized protein n=1 Tax=Bacteroides pyogenes F0041 TaxID=1321819 RepID=U2CVX9_9BACE|nr:hypothetical protein HMPREF1981_00395 [Bacteroides pyogenes F0041]
MERSGRSLVPTPKGPEVYGIVKEKMIANVSDRKVEMSIT